MKTRTDPVLFVDPVSFVHRLASARAHDAAIIAIGKALAVLRGGVP